MEPLLEGLEKTSYREGNTRVKVFGKGFAAFFIRFSLAACAYLRAAPKQFLTVVTCATARVMIQISFLVPGETPWHTARYVKT